MQHIIGIWNETLNLWMDMGVYLVFGFAVAGILSRVLRQSTVQRHLGGNSLVSVAKASLFGIPLPLCSCGVLPVGISLRNRGASRPAATSFLISTPQTGVDSIIVTYGFLGPVFAVARPVAALINGLFGGMLSAWFGGEQNDAAGAAAPACPTGDGCAIEDDAPRGGLGAHLLGALRYGFLEFPREISFWLVASIALAGLLAYVLPDEKAILAENLGTGILPMLAMLVIGIPLYICSTASVPLVAVLVTQGGLSAGAALVFLMAGPATNAAGLVLIAKSMGKRTAAIYLFSIVVTAMVCGLALEAAYAAMGTSLAVRAAEHAHQEMLPQWLRVGGAVALLVVAATALVRNQISAHKMRHAGPASEEEETMQLKVEGMTCQNCAEHVRKAAESVEGVESARVDLKPGILHIAGDSPNREALARAIADAGYRLTDSQSE